MSDLQTLYAWQTNIIDLHPLQHLYCLVHITLNESKVIDSPLKNLDLDEFYICANKIQNFLPIQHHKNFPIDTQDESDEEQPYDICVQQIPTTEELKFYNKILSVHTSHKQTREIKNENRITKFRVSFELKKSYVSVMLNNQIMKMNKEVDILVRFIQHIQLE
ncbi:Hypothetical_protein [Hexamita inflata]|uniref:Hypothetical_protein n=1 Tax=Hexamita inflata TaxID=28002 RepID=A0AA86NRQ2_9EUKA|nr:Hypothetical protein HINF_LOCUS11738 [Hexamita inflata]